MQCFKSCTGHLTESKNRTDELFITRDARPLFIRHSLVLSSFEGCQKAMSLSIIFGRTKKKNLKIIQFNYKVIQY